MKRLAGKYDDEYSESSGLRIYGRMTRTREDARPVKVRVTHEFTDAERLQIAQHYGEDGKASRELLRRWIEDAVRLATTTKGESKQ